MNVPGSPFFPAIFYPRKSKLQTLKQEKATLLKSILLQIMHDHPFFIKKKKSQKLRNGKSGVRAALRNIFKDAE
jgi:hypothetical protein